MNNKTRKEREHYKWFYREWGRVDREFPNLGSYARQQAFVDLRRRSALFFEQLRNR